MAVGRGRVRSVCEAAAVGAAALFAALAATAVEAQDSDIYLGGFSDGRKPVIFWVFSDSSADGLAPQDAVGLYVDPDKPRDAAFEPERDCQYTYDFPVKLARPHLDPDPIYGPNAKQRTIDTFALPTYMSRETARIIIQRRLAGRDETVRDYFNCAGFVWAELLDQPPEVWQRILKESLERGVVPRE